jgi:hypothetical protein
LGFIVSQLFMWYILLSRFRSQWQPEKQALKQKPRNTKRR